MLASTMNQQLPEVDVPLALTEARTYLEASLLVEDGQSLLVDTQSSNLCFTAVRQLHILALGTEREEVLQNLTQRTPHDVVAFPELLVVSIWVTENVQSLNQTHSS